MNETDDDEVLAASYMDSVDSYRLVRRNRKQNSRQNGGGGGRSGREFCRCKRGPVGYPGAPGMSIFIRLQLQYLLYNIIYIYS